MLNFVIPGFYISNDSIDSDTQNIIRVLDEDPEKDNYFRVMNQKNSLSEHYILDNYTFMSTSVDKNSAESHNRQINKTVELGDLTSINNEISLNEDIKHKIDTSEVNTFNDNNSNIVKNVETIIKTVHVPVDEESVLLKRTIDKVKTDKISKFKVTLEIESNYDIDKLTTIADLMDINIDKLLIEIINSNQVLSSIINQIKSKKDVVEELEFDEVIENNSKFDDDEKFIEGSEFDDDEEFIEGSEFDDDEEFIEGSEFDDEEEFIEGTEFDDFIENNSKFEKEILEHTSLVNKYIKNNRNN